MIYFLSIFLSIYLLILLKKPSLVFLIFPRLLELIFSILGFATFDVNLNWTIHALLVLYFFIGIVQIKIIYTPKYISQLKSFSSSNIFQRKLDNKIFLFTFIFLIIIILLLSGSLDILNPRRFYEFLVFENINSNNILMQYVWPLIAFLLGDLLTSFSYSFTNLILSMGLAYFIGSKGLFFYPIIFYGQYTYLFNKKWRIPLIIILSSLLIVLLPFYISTLTSFDLKIFFSGYFDFFQNVEKIQASIKVFPDLRFALASITKYIPGSSRLLNVSYVEMYKHYFYFDFQMGKNPGLLMFDDILRLGILFFPFVMLLEAYIIRTLLNVYDNNYFKIPTRSLILSNSIRGSLIVYALFSLTNYIKKLYFKKT